MSEQYMLNSREEIILPWETPTPGKFIGDTLFHCVLGEKGGDSSSEVG